MTFTRLSRLDAGERAALAERNGYQAEANIGLDQIQSVRQYAGKSTKQADAVLEWWKQYSEGRGVPLHRTVYPGMPVPEREYFKDFLRYYIATHEGLLRHPETGKRRPSPSTRTVLKQASRWYFGFEMRTGTTVGEEYRAEIRLWAMSQLQKKEKIISGAFRAKPTYGWHQLHTSVVSWFSRPMPVFIHGRDFVQTPGLTTLFGFTGARIAAFVEGSSYPGSKRVLTYGDLKVMLFNTPSGIPKICIHVVSRYTKNNNDPLNRFYGQGIKGHDRLVYDVPSFLLALAFADDAFEHCRTPAQLWSLRLPLGKDSFHVPWKASKLNTPIFRSSTRAGGTSDNALTANRFDYYFGIMAIGAGFGDKFTVHAVRRYYANETDHLYTPAERSTPLGHADSDALQSSTHTRYYVATHTSAVDGQAVFLGEKPDPEFIERMQRTQVLQEDDLPQRLPMQRQLEMMQNPKIVELNARLDQKRASGASRPALQSLKRSIHSTLQTVKREELRTFQREWLTKRSNDFITAQLESGHENTAEVISSNNEAFLALCELIPERKRLAKLISSAEPCSRQEKLEAVQDMTAVCTMDHRIVYYPGERPVNHACPVPTCRIDLQSWDLRTSSSHIHDCRRKEFIDESHANAVRTGHSVTSARTEFCLLCFTWVFGNEAWESHCESHLRCMLLLNYMNCEVISYGLTVICPGLCAFCLRDRRLPSEKLVMFKISGLLRVHLHLHLDDLDSWPQPCPYPCCKSSFQDRFGLECHFADAHGHKRILSGGAGHKSSLSEEVHSDTFDVEPFETDLMDSDTGDVDLFDVKQGQKRSLDQDDGSSDGLPAKEAKLETYSPEGSPLESAMVPFDPQVWTRESTMDPWEKWTPEDYATPPDTIDLTLSDNEMPGVDPSNGDTETTYAILAAARQETNPGGPACPVCHAPVTESVEVYGRNRLSVAEQRAFCHAHKVKRAERDWNRKGYPRIDWEGLPARLTRFIEPLQRILLDGRLSYFRSELVKEDEDRVEAPAWRGLESGIPGYYGPRGTDIMHEFLTPTFSNQLNRLAVIDTAILNTGVAGYICRVLTPELATMLIKEDMKVEDAEARVILWESVALGTLVNSDT